jgi:hypothetical protein
MSINRFGIVDTHPAVAKFLLQTLPMYCKEGNKRNNECRGIPTELEVLSVFVSFETEV